jgi:hypothetical protein
MATVKSWNDMLDSFLNELEATFPEELSIKKYHATYDLLVQTNPRVVLDQWTATTAPFQQQIMDKDETIFLSDDGPPFLREINIHKHWTPDLSENTKSAIWQYISTLTILANTISILPADTMNMIESIAAKCAADMESQGVDEKQLGGLLSSLQNMLEKK